MKHCEHYRDLLKLIFTVVLISVTNLCFATWSWVVEPFQFALISQEEHTVTIGVNWDLRNDRQLTNVVIPERVILDGLEYEVVKVGDFSDVFYMESCIIPSTIREIENGAFSECLNLNYVYIPSSTLLVAPSAFSRCKNLRNLVIDENNPNYSSENGILFNKDKTTLYAYPSANGSVIIPDGMVNLNNSALYKQDLASVTLPPTVKSIGDGALWGTKKVICLASNPPSRGNDYYHKIPWSSDLFPEDENWKIDWDPSESPSDPNLIPTYVPDESLELYKSSSDWRYVPLYPLSSLKPDDPSLISNILINGIYYNLDPENLTASTTYMTQLPENSSYVSGKVEIPEYVSYQDISYKVTSIGDYSFYNCEELSGISIPKTVETIGTAAFYGCRNLKTVNVNDLEAWCGVKFENYESNPLYYKGNLFVNNEEVSKLVIPATVKQINKYAFVGCNSIESLEIADNVLSVGESAFSGCGRLTDLKIGESVETIGRNCFSDCNNLKNLIFNARNCDIQGGRELQAMPRSLKNLVFGDNVTNINYYAFNGCRELTDIELPMSLKEIGIGAFKGCYGLSKITIPEEVRSIGNFAFENTGIKTVEYNSIDVTTNGIDIFPKKITSVKLGRNVENIPGFLFTGCKELTSVIFPESLKTIGERAFEGCEGLTELVFHPNLISIGKQAFENCRSLEVLTFSSDKELKLGEWCFDYCPSIETINCKTKVPPVGETSYVFLGDTYSLASLYIPEGTLQAYRSTSPWNMFLNIFEKDFSQDSEVSGILGEEKQMIVVYTLDGKRVMTAGDPNDLEKLPKGLYIINGRKTLLH